MEGRRGKRGRTGLREGLSCNAVTKETSVDPQGAEDLGWLCGVGLKN